MFRSGAAFANTIVLFKQRAYFWPEENIYNERNAFRIQDTACWPMRVVKSGQIEQWLLKQKAQFSGEKDNGSLKDKMLIPKQTHLDSGIKVSSWRPLHFMTRPPLSSSQLSPGCSSHVGCGQDGGSQASMASTISIISTPIISISIILIMTISISVIISSIFILHTQVMWAG